MKTIDFITSSHKKYYSEFCEEIELKYYYDRICTYLISYFNYSVLQAITFVLDNLEYFNETYKNKVPIDDAVIDIFPICG